MKKKELRSQLLSRLSSMLEPYGFVLIRRMDWFVRKGDSNLIFRLDFYDGHWKDIGYTVSPSVAVRIDEVELIYHQVSGFEPKYQKDTPTIWVTVQELKKEGEEYEYALDVHENVDSLAQQLFIIFKEIALPFFEENSSIQRINRLLNADPENDKSIFCIPEDRYFKGVIVAKLARDDRYALISQIYRNKSMQYLPYRVADFERLLRILEEY